MPWLKGTFCSRVWHVCGICHVSWSWSCVCCKIASVTMPPLERCRRHSVSKLLSVHAWLYSKSVLARYLMHRLWLFRQIYDLGAVGHRLPTWMNSLHFETLRSKGQRSWSQTTFSENALFWYGHIDWQFAIRVSGRENIRFLYSFYVLLFHVSTVIRHLHRIE